MINILTKIDLEYILNLILYQELLIKVDKETTKKVIFNGKEMRREAEYLKDLKNKINMKKQNLM